VSLGYLHVCFCVFLLKLSPIIEHPDLENGTGNRKFSSVRFSLGLFGTWQRGTYFRKLSNSSAFLSLVCFCLEPLRFGLDMISKHLSLDWKLCADCWLQTSWNCLAGSPSFASAVHKICNQIPWSVSCSNFSWFSRAIKPWHVYKSPGTQMRVMWGFQSVKQNLTKFI